MRKFVLLLILCLMSVSIAAAQEAPPAEVEVSESLIEQVEAIEDYVVDVRGLDELNPVTRVFPTRIDVATYLQESVDEQLTQELIDQSLAFYYAFDFIDDPQLDIVGIYLDLIEDQIGGYYDPEDKTMNTILISGEGKLGDELPLLEQIIYAHEFVHALQDQHYDLAELGFSSDTDPDEIELDRFMARQALVEGDATYVMNLFTEAVVSENPFAAVALLGATFSSGSATIPEGTPDILTRELFFPYNNGLVFVTALVEDGGMAAVDAAFADLPVSTEHILHPEKYIAGEMPIPVTLSATEAALGKGWALVDEDTLGEFYLRAYLDTHLERAVWLPAAEGWGGDRFQIYRSDDGDIAMVMRLAWDTPTDSDEFADVFGQWGEARFGTPASDNCWSGDEAICFATLDSGENVITRAPDIEQARALLATQ